MKAKLGLAPRSLIQIVLIIWTVTQLFPILWMFYSSFKPTGAIQTNIWSLPKSMYFGNFVSAWTAGTRGYSVAMFFKNSIIVTVSSLALLAVIPAMAAYAMAKLQFPGRVAAVIIMLLLISVPVHSIIIPLYYFLDRFRLINNYLGLVLVYVASNIPFSVLLLQSFYREFPEDIIEVARLEGCNEMSVFFRVVLPMTKGAVSTVLIVSFINIWNEFLFALIVMKDNTLKTFPVGLNIFKGIYGTEWGALMASLTSASLIAFVFYFVFQKQIASGMSVGALKE